MTGYAFLLRFSLPTAFVAAAGVAMLVHPQSPAMANGTGAIDQTWANAAQRADAEERGRVVFSAHCASCHGEDLKGQQASHTPDLTDAFWLLGGADDEAFQIHPSDVELIVRNGIRSETPNARLAVPMPGRDDPASAFRNLSDAQVEDLVSYVTWISGQGGDRDGARRGKEIFGNEGTCYDCHGDDGIGDSSIGASDLTAPKQWLYGAAPADIRETILKGRGGVSPAYAGKLSEGDIRDVSIYVYAAAGGYDF